MLTGDRSRCALLVTVLVVAGASSPSRVGAAGPAKSPDGLWTSVEPIAAEGVRARINAAAPDAATALEAQRLVTLDRERLRGVLNSALAPEERRLEMNQGRAAARVAPLPELDIPLPDRSYARFRIEPTRVMSEGLAEKYPQIRTFRGQGVADPTMTLKIDDTPIGFHAQIVTPGKATIYVDPVELRTETYTSYAKQAPRPERRGFQCLLPENAGGPPAARPEARRAGPAATRLRTYRLAVACTGEYAGKFLEPGNPTPTKAGALSGIVATVSRLNTIYEIELGVHFVLVDRTDDLLFTNPNTDGLSNDDADALINESQALIDRVIGNANYDIGHTVSTGGGGLAELACVCVVGHKARGITGSENPKGDGFDVDFVAHEIGHQFGGNHTFNSPNGSCRGNRNHTTAVEPGSGSTIQAYAGICRDDDLQRNSDDYFHAVSLDEMVAFLTAGAASVVPGVLTGNTPPTVTAPSSVSIPRSTPFILTAAGSDPDGDSLHYCWEELDPGGHAAPLTSRDDGQIPLFRSFKPTLEPFRVFPRMPLLLAGASAGDEKLPIRNRTLRFRVTARDGRAGLGDAETLVTVHETVGPFQVTAPAAGARLGRAAEVKWDVAGTDSEAFGVTHVNILLTTDNGQTFVALASDTPNDGAQVVNLPSEATALARIKVEAVDGVFFALSPGNFTIDPSRPAAPSGVAVVHSRPSDGDGLSANGILATTLGRDTLSSMANGPEAGAGPAPASPTIVIVNAPEKVAEILRLVGTGAHGEALLEPSALSPLARRLASDGHRADSPDDAELHRKLDALEAHIREIRRRLGRN